MSNLGLKTTDNNHDSQSIDDIIPLDLLDLLETVSVNNPSFGKLVSNRKGSIEFVESNDNHTINYIHQSDTFDKQTFSNFKNLTKNGPLLHDNSAEVQDQDILRCNDGLQDNLSDIIKKPSFGISGVVLPTTNNNQNLDLAQESDNMIRKKLLSLYPKPAYNFMSIRDLILKWIIIGIKKLDNKVRIFIDQAKEKLKQKIKLQSDSQPTKEQLELKLAMLHTVLDNGEVANNVFSNTAEPSFTYFEDKLQVNAKAQLNLTVSSVTLIKTKNSIYDEFKKQKTNEDRIKTFDDYLYRKYTIISDISEGLGK